MNMQLEAMVLDPIAEAERLAMDAKRSAFIASDLQGDFDKLTKDWTPIHRRMADDERQFNDSEKYVGNKDRPVDGDVRDAPTLAITFSRTIITASRRADMLLPNNDDHGECIPDEVPHIPEQDVLEANGEEPIPEADVIKTLKARADKMSKRIRSQYAETRFEPKVRRMLEDSSRVGWGVLKGPCMGVRKRKVHKGELAPDGQTLKMISITEIKEEHRPDVEYVNPWHFIADLAPTIGEAEKAFRIRLLTDRDVRGLSMTPNVDKAAIRRIVAKPPIDIGSSPILAMYSMKNQALGLTENLREVYVFLEYNGPLRKKWAEEIPGVDKNGEEQITYRFGGLKTLDGPFEWIDDGNPIPMVEISFCQGEVVTFKEVPLEADDGLMYLVDTCHRIDDTFAGGGIPYLLRSIDRAIQGSWQMGLHNAAMSASPTIFMRKGVCKPSDGKNRLNAPKIFLVESATQQLNDIVKEIVTPNNAEQFLQLLDKAMMLADEIINLPLIAQGKQAEETAQGQAVRMNTNNIFQKRMALGTDDSVLCPMGERMIEWNLTYGEAKELGGDFRWKSRVNGLLVKDQQTQNLQAATMMASQPQFAAYLDNYTLLKRNFEALDIATDGIILPEDEAREREKAMSQQPPDPMIAVKEQEIAQKDRKIEADTGIAQQKVELSKAELASKERIADLSYQEAVSRLALDEDITLAEVMTALQASREQATLKRTEIGAKVGVEAQKIAAKERSDRFEVAAEKNRPKGPVLQ